MGKRKVLFMGSPILDLYAFAMEDYQHINSPLIEVRRQFFADPAATDYHTHTIQAESGEMIRYRFLPKGFSWRVRSGQGGQRSIKGKDGAYEIRIFGADGSIFRSEHFGADHRLQKVVYYQQNMLRGEITINEMGEAETVFLESEEGVFRRRKFVACPWVPYEPKEAYHRFTKMLGVPPMIGYTVDGVLCYYTEADAARAKQLAELPGKVPEPNIAPDPLPEAVPENRSDPVAPEAVSEPACVSTDAANKRYYACGKLQAGKCIGGDTPLPAELYDALKEAIQPPPAAEHIQDIRTADGDWRLQYTGNVLDYAGEIRNGERNGFGVRMDPGTRTAQAGTWVYNGFCGLEMQTADTGAVYARFLDTARSDMQQGATAIFRADGALLYCGAMHDRLRDGFGAALRSDQTYYIGQWSDDQPNGNGVLLTADGLLLYQGQWKNGVRDGTGTAYRAGRMIYTGSWKNDRYDGSGTQIRPDGGRIVGRFAAGEPSGTVCEYAGDGRKVYEGAMSGGKRNGPGTLWRPDGSALTGIFLQDELDGTVEERDASGELLYRGTYAGNKRSGHGMLYRNGIIQYEGAFANGIPDGRGKQYENGDLVYAGELHDGIRCGVGAALAQGVPVYFGEWDRDRPNGWGVEYQDGEAAFAGHFDDGQKNGRVNAYAHGRLVREMLCRNDEPEYMIEYGEDAIYAGAVYDGKRSGLGRLLNAYCECEQQGVFKDGQFQRAAQVIPRRLDALTCPDRLRGTPYEEIACPADGCILGLPIRDGIYSGQTHLGVPNGRGTIAYADHIYTGQFANGYPSGDGQLYLSTGEVINGRFGEEPNAETLHCGAVSYTFVRTAG